MHSPTGLYPEDLRDLSVPLEEKQREIAETCWQDNQGSLFAELYSVGSQVNNNPELRDSLLSVLWYWSFVPESWLRHVFGFLSKREVRSIAKSSDLHAEYRCLYCEALLPTEDKAHHLRQRETLEFVRLATLGTPILAEQLADLLCKTCIEKLQSTDKTWTNGLRSCS